MSKKRSAPRTRSDSRKPAGRGSARGRARAPRATAPRATDLGTEIVALLEREGAPLPANALASRLGRAQGDDEDIEAAVAALESRGLVVRNRVGSLLSAGRIALVAGRIEGHNDGHGLLIPDSGEPPILLSHAEMRQALHGDRATVRVTGRDPRGRPAGAIVEVFRRERRRIVGRLHNEHGVLFLVPEDRRIAQDVLVPPADAGPAKAGQVVTVELIVPPSLHAQPIGRVVEVIGRDTDPGIEIEIALRKFDLPHAFAAGVTKAAAALADEVGERDRAGRRDLREFEFVTIDGETAKDFDDAVLCVPEGHGHRLYVAIADVSHYVRPGSVLDAEARERGTSVYFPRRVIPMLPEKLSNGLCSLNPRVDRLAMVCEMSITPRGEIARYQFYEAVIRSHARLTYEAVWAELGGSAKDPAVAAHAVALRALQAVFERLFAARQRRGAIDFETVETRMQFNERGRIERIVPTARTEAHRIIEECMLAANVCAGKLLAERGHAVLYRVHEMPSADKVAVLREFLGGLGLQLPGGDAPRPKDYAQLIEQIRDRPDRGLLQMLALRSLKQAVYSPDNAGHFGLAFDAYVHFTSPIRRYPDLLAHRAIKACRAGKTYAEADWEALGVHCSMTERRADDAGRDVENWLKCDYMKDRVGEDFDAAITGVTAFGVFVTLDAVFVDGLVHISELGRDYFQFDPSRHHLIGERTGKRFRLADPMRVRLVRVDLETRRMDFVPA